MKFRTGFIRYCPIHEGIAVHVKGECRRCGAKEIILEERYKPPNDDKEDAIIYLTSHLRAINTQT